jgi:hypothetical protein
MQRKQAVEMAGVSTNKDSASALASPIEKADTRHKRDLFAALRPPEAWLAGFLFLLDF